MRDFAQVGYNYPMGVLMTSITFNHITKHLYRDGEPQKVIDDLSLKIPSGDVLALLGPSGSGKTTLLRIAAGLEAPDEGEVYYDNVDLRDVPLDERRIGMVFQQDTLIPHWISRRSVGFFLSLRKREHELPERVHRISQITGFGIEHLMGRLPRHLSGGERQRVSVARALARDAHVLFFDEPFANLDAALRTNARIELKRLLNEFHVTTIFVTHDQNEAVGIAKRIAVLDAGQIVQVGAYSHLYRSPKNLLMAAFIGTPTINLFEGYVADGEWRGENFGGFPIRADLPAHRRVTMGIRAEFIHLVAEGVPAVVDVITPYYAERFQLLDVHLGKEHWTIQVPLEDSIELGSTVYCQIDPEGILYFDPQTGNRIG